MFEHKNLFMYTKFVIRKIHITVHMTGNIEQYYRNENENFYFF
jgi:hypothetical protein